MLFKYDGKYYHISRLDRVFSRTVPWRSGEVDAQHKQLVQKVRRFQRRLEMERISMPVLEFLVNWVGHHIMTSDQEIGRYARGRSGAEAVATSPAGSSL